MNEYDKLILALLIIVGISCVLTWITYEYGIDPSYECSSNKNNTYCKKYISGGIGEIIYNDYYNIDPVATYKIYEQTYKCGLHHVNNEDYPVGTTFNIYFKKDESTLCVTESYNENYKKKKALSQKNSARIASFLLCYAYLVILFYIVAISYIHVENYNTNQNTNQTINNNNNPELITTDDIEVPVYFEEDDIEANNLPQTTQPSNKNEVKQNVYKIPDELKTPIDLRIPSPPTSNSVFFIDNNNECHHCLQSLTNGEPYVIPPCRHVFHRSCYEDLISDNYVNCPVCEQSFV